MLAGGTAGVDTAKHRLIVAVAALPAKDWIRNYPSDSFILSSNLVKQHKGIQEEVAKIEDVRRLCAFL